MSTAPLSATAPVVPPWSLAMSPALRGLAGLARPRILGLVVFTALPALRRVDGSWPEPGALLGILAGLALLGLACDALNAFIERRSDALMERTRHRPLPSGRLAPAAALTFGLGAAAASLLLLLAAGGPLAAGLACVTLVHYVLVYTLWAKPRTHLAALIGAPAGAAAPLIAGAAAEGRLALLPVLLFAFILLWTPPHTWAIALFRHQEYSAAGLPTLPAVHGEGSTRIALAASAVLAVLASLALPFAPRLGPATCVAAVVLGTGLLVHVAQERRVGTATSARRLFRATVLHAMLLLTVVLCEVVLSA